MNLDDSLLEVLVCPACRAEVRQDHDAQELVCQGCGLAYPVRDDVPVMLVDEARQPSRRQPSRPAAASASPGSDRETDEVAAAEGPGDVPPPGTGG